MAFKLIVLCLTLLSLKAQELASVDVYAVVEITFTGSPQPPARSPARDTDFWLRIRHESGSPDYRIQGFWDGGAIFKIRFCPTQPGRWKMVEVHSNDPRLNGQNQGRHIQARPGSRHGFWQADPQSPGSRWYRRSDGSHQYIFGNTHYGFVSQIGVDGRPSGNTIKRDIEANALYFKKLRFSAVGDRYPDPTTGPFQDETGQATYDGAWSHRPNPAWFRDRVDLAVKSAFEVDLIADLILAGPDFVTSRTTLNPARNDGDPTPYLRYIAARYGAYPNVWICLANEFDIKEPRYTAARVVQIGALLRGLLPYPTPISVHRASGPWPQELNAQPWNDHVIVQQKLKTLAEAADIIDAAQKAGGNKPVIDDELSYQGAGDGHTEADTLESHLGAFLGGGYGTTGHKASGPRPGAQAPKTGQYFTGGFDAQVHSAAQGLKFLRDIIDGRITFWKMSPGAGMFNQLDPAFRAMAWPEHEYVLGTDKAAKIQATLPAGKWDIRSYDVIARKESTVLMKASGEITFDAPASRAVLFHIVKTAAR